LGQTEYVPPEVADRIQSLKHCVLNKNRMAFQMKTGHWIISRNTIVIKTWMPETYNLSFSPIQITVQLLVYKTWHSNGL
jgi:hypothetical protein